MKKVLVFFLFMYPFFLMAQIKTVRGHVLFGNAENIKGIKVLVTSRNIVTELDENGNFILSGITDEDLKHVVLQTSLWHRNIEYTNVSSTQLNIARPKATDSLGVFLLTDSTAINTEIHKGSFETNYNGQNYKDPSKIKLIKMDKNAASLKYFSNGYPKGIEVQYKTFVDLSTVAKLPKVQDSTKTYKVSDFFRNAVSFGNVVNAKIKYLNRSTVLFDLGQTRQNSPIPDAYHDSYNANLHINNFRLNNWIKLDAGVLYNNSTIRLPAQGSNMASLMYSVLTTPLISSTINANILVNNMLDKDKSDHILSYMKIYLAKERDLNSSLSFSYEKEWSNRHAGIQQSSTENRYSFRKEQMDNFNVNLNTDYKLNNKLIFNFTALVNVQSELVNRGDSIQNVTANSSSYVTDHYYLDRTSFNLKYGLTYQERRNHSRYGFNLFAVDYVSSTLSKSENHNFYPAFSGYWSPWVSGDLRHFARKILGRRFVNNTCSFFGTISKSMGESSLVYRNLSALSTIYNSSNFSSFYEYQDIVWNSSLKPEKYLKREVGIKGSLLPNKLNYEFLYFNNTTTDFIAPDVLTNGSDYKVNLNNVGDIKNEGLLFNAEYIAIKKRKYGLNFKYSVSHVRSTVQKVNAVGTESGYTRPDNLIRLSGFSNIATVFVDGETVGAIYGTTYSRNAQGQIITDASGDPVINTELKKIGDPTPDFVMNFSPIFSYYNLAFSFNVEYSEGGDRWNGTQAWLDNVKYGTTKAGEAYIEDATYLRLSNVSLSYVFIKNKRHLISKLFDDIIIGAHANNLLLLTKYKGVDPSSTLFGYAGSTGLDLFNAPSVRSYTLSLTFKL